MWGNGLGNRMSREVTKCGVIWTSGSIVGKGK